MAKVIALSNQKSGVGKTTTCANLGIGLARHGKKVLVIDADPQGSLTASLGNSQPDKIATTLATIMGKILSDIPIDPSEGIIHHEEGIDLLPANIELSAIDLSLVNAMSRETVLRQYIDTIKPLYDYILLDCMPSLGIQYFCSAKTAFGVRLSCRYLVTINALACVDSIIIPVQAQYLSVKGLEQLLHSIAKVKKQINPSLSITGILITMVDVRTNYAKDIINLLKGTYDKKLHIFKNDIPLSVRASEISVEGKSIFVHDPGCMGEQQKCTSFVTSPNGRVALAYESLTKEVLSYE